MSWWAFRNVSSYVEQWDFAHAGAIEVFLNFAQEVEGSIFEEFTDGGALFVVGVEFVFENFVIAVKIG